MTLLRLHDVPWDMMLCSYAAFHSKLALLQWLRKNSCPWTEYSVLYNAGRSGSVATLEWLATVTPAWTDAHKQQMLNRAGWNDRLAAVQWLRERGAKWPAKFAGHFTAAGTGATVHQCWSLTAVQRATASGSGWLDWHCEDYAADKFSYLVAKQHAATVLEWAHANGCPCTCGQ
jgi:hypothetical protein